MLLDITAAQIKAFAPRCRKEYLEAFEALEPWLGEVGLLSTAQRWAHFMAQMAHESAGFALVEENLNYTAERLCKVFPKRFRSLEQARLYAHRPEDLANLVYGGRLGNDAAGDGWRYRGRGPIQLTGKANYAEMGKKLGANLEGLPDLAAKGEVALRIAVTFFLDRGCLQHADRDDVVALTRAINGGLNGLAERRMWLAKAKRTWPEAHSPKHQEASPPAVTVTEAVGQSRSVQVGTVVTGATAAAAAAKELAPMEALKEVSTQAGDIEKSVGPLLSLWKLVAGNLWPSLTGVLAVTVIYMVWRNIKARREGRHV